MFYTNIITHMSLINEILILNNVYKIFIFNDIVIDII